MTIPSVCTNALDAYQQVSGYTRQDAANGYPLLKLLDVIYKNTTQPIDDIVRDTDTLPGWGKLLDVDTCPVWALPWLAEVHGAALTSGMTDTAMRAAIRTPTGPSRGNPTAIIAAIQARLTGSRTVVWRERYDGSGFDAPDHTTIRVRLDETTDPTALAALVASMKPIGRIYDFAALDGADYQFHTDHETTYTARSTAFATYADATADRLG